MRSEPRSGAEMVSALLFGESYDVLQTGDDWLEIQTHFDNYKGWISANTHNPFQENFTRIVDTVYTEAVAKGDKLMIPCGGQLPADDKPEIQGQRYEIKFNLKPSHHLPLPIRLVNTAKSFLNAPYLWGGRCFMGIDCSGLTQVVFKANGITIPRDTKQQIEKGENVNFGSLQTGDLVFFSKPGLNKVSHVGMMINATEIIHASGKVKIEKLQPEGLYKEGVQVYETIARKRLF